MHGELPAIAACAALVLGLGGCATRTPVSGRFPPVTPRAAQGGQYTGETVRWGGILIKTEPEADRTCFRVMGLPLDSDGRPQRGTGETETGRFVACARGFYDPVLYAEGRRITFIGKVAGVKREAVGGYKYPYPRLSASVVYLWPKVVPKPRPQPYPYYGPYGPYYWGPWGPWDSDFWWSPWGLGPPPPYVRNPHDDGHRPPARPPAPPPSGGGSGNARPPPPRPPLRIHGMPHPVRPGLPPVERPVPPPAKPQPPPRPRVHPRGRPEHPPPRLRHRKRHPPPARTHAGNPLSD